MKLRLKGNSLRLRVTRSELAMLQTGGRIEESVLFPGVNPSSLTYVLGVGEQQSEPVHVGFQAHQIHVRISEEKLRGWSEEGQVGVYESLPVTQNVSLEVALEKDFACLDLSDEDNADAFANPLATKVC